VKIRRRKYKSGHVAFQLDKGEVDGRRVQVSFKTRVEAQRELDKILDEKQRYGELGDQASSADLAEFLTLKARCADLGGSLPEAVEFWARHGKTLRERLLMPEVLKQFLDEKHEAGRSARYRMQLGVSLGPLCAGLATVQACDVTREHITRWLRGNAWAPKTVNNYLGDARALFVWAQKRGLVTVDPCAGIERSTTTAGEIQAIKVGQCHAMLVRALTMPVVMPYLVIAMFGGVRPEEIQKLSWREVDLEGRTVIVLGRTSKTRQRRVVNLTENAVAWIKAGQPEKEGMICPRGWRNIWQRFRRESGYIVPRSPKTNVMPWVHDGLRHTFASNHYAMHEDEAKLQVQMGHESAAVLHQHYRALTTRVDAAKFWDLWPWGASCPVPKVGLTERRRAA